MGGMSVVVKVLVAAHHHLTDTEQEAGIASDAHGRVCNFGPSHDECHDQFLERTNENSN
jgi:hypothetical protein